MANRIQTQGIENFRFIGDVIGQAVGRTTFYRHFPPDCIKQLGYGEILWAFREPPDR